MKVERRPTGPGVLCQRGNAVVLRSVAQGAPVQTSTPANVHLLSLPPCTRHLSHSPVSVSKTRQIMSSINFLRLPDALIKNARINLKPFRAFRDSLSSTHLRGLCEIPAAPQHIPRVCEIPAAPQHIAGVCARFSWPQIISGVCVTFLRPPNISQGSV